MHGDSGTHSDHFGIGPALDLMLAHGLADLNRLLPDDTERCGPCERGETAEVGGFIVHLCDHATTEWMYAGWCPCCGQLPYTPVKNPRAA